MLDRIARPGAFPGVMTLALLLLFGAVSPLSGQETEQAEKAARGRVSYRIYCSNCHGDTATGDGELAELLKVRPTNLTELTEKYENEFPTDWIHKLVDGRQNVRGHGMAEMPVWGLAFRNPEDSGRQDEQIAAKIADLVAYLESIQRPSSD